jgi:hypothetical protein
MRRRDVRYWPKADIGWCSANVCLIIAPSRGILIAMSISGTIHVRPVLVCMGSKSEYLANARECEGRAQEMPPALRQTFESLAAHWRKLASNAAEDRRSLADQKAADRRKADKG